MVGGIGERLSSLFIKISALSGRSTLRITCSNGQYSKFSSYRIYVTSSLFCGKCYSSLPSPVQSKKRQLQSASCLMKTRLPVIFTRKYYCAILHVSGSFLWGNLNRIYFCQYFFFLFTFLEVLVQGALQLMWRVLRDAFRTIKLVSMCPLNYEKIIV